MDGYIITGIIVAIAFAALAGRKSQAALKGMEDTPISIENVRKGVANGWYTCTLVVVDGTPAVHLSGCTANGKPYSDVYPITKEDWDALKNEGYKVEL